ncbi:MAG: carboxypeptidase regulatory-like domain-containing protein [Planctomycetes bacterium]|nr:carboxypeptidase regulatory-like domain-containing protein [Planctomycetota bacterium]
MRTSSLLAGLFALLIVGGVAFGAGYFVAKTEFESAPKTEPVVAKDDTLDKPVFDEGPLQAPDKNAANTEATTDIQPKVAGTDPDQPATTTNEQPADDLPKPADTSVEAQPKPGVPTTEDLEAAEVGNALEEIKKKLGDLKDIDTIDPESFEEMLNGPKVDFSATVSGQVVDASGVPVAGAEVRATFSEDYTSEDAGNSVRFVTSIGDSNSGSVIATTDGGGYFTAEINRKISEKARLSAGLTANADGYAESKKNSATLKNGETKEGIKLVLRGAGGVTGRVVDSSGRGVEGVTVGLNSAGGNSFGDNIEFNYGGSSKYSAKTDVGGNFNIEGVPEGRYKFKLSGSGYRQVSGPTEVDVKTGLIERAATDFQVAVTSSVRIAFIDVDGKPIQGWANVKFLDDSGKTVKQLNGPVKADGVFEQNDPPAGTFSVEIKLWGYKTHKVNATLLDGQRFDFGTITLERDENASGGSTVIIPDDE